jgi:hypothetical protein
MLYYGYFDEKSGQSVLSAWSRICPRPRTVLLLQQSPSLQRLQSVFMLPLSLVPPERLRFLPPFRPAL